MDSVYQPAEDSFLMLEELSRLLSSVRGPQKTQDRRPKAVLDMGTGSGILAIAAAKAGCSVTAADINPEAIKVAKENAKKEGAGIDFIVSDLFDNVSGKFDLIIFNPPYVPTEPNEKKDMESAAWDGGKDGMTVITEFLKRVKGFLKPEGRILLLISTIDDKEPKLKGFKTKVKRKESLFFERLWVLELEPS